ncbi:MULTISPECIES: type III secretion system export apparatus subunit SctT [Xanthomonas]|uniref:EscT/YscT/HrcT family type III secretion system export apparatus protein n=1 Tax=Xanthomonas cucurbitae TaxID=56453 RepID=A0A2S7DF68_9XANT|nr:type III secretion system export apparatus subunit SctT [Xanthomonas cucurbitae]PPU72459.1 EscT/YscT/HrcT family type III secretion system export apparatus protein [Xanthomonas cucurbitae]QHG88370.1 EscT/YscT/HrcT family type III secretion system export apparatus protein [Xanthomonas cucurbitae]WDM67226.1 type III secretion system export apparatus subunit SctT [Xanthomonas cucurbitae]WDM71104.1 type III secretion system export apparatus subunit SctT [Xanthomonas cucurbitae]WDM74937.1 type I
MTDLGNALVALSSQGLGLLTLLALCGVRVFVVFSILPATAQESLPGLVRNGVIYVLSTFIAYGQPDDTLSRIQAVGMVGLVFKEAFIGMLIGFAASTVFWVAESIGLVVDDLAGYNNVQMINPLSGQQSTPVSTVLLQLSIVSFYALGGMLMLLAAVFESFQWWPLTHMSPDLGAVVESFVIQQADGMLIAIVKLSAPVMLVLVFVDLAIGFVARAADKLEPSNLSQPIRGVLALLLLSLLMGVFIAQFSESLGFVHFQQQLRGAASAGKGGISH